MEVIIEGKVKTVYAGDDADRVIIEYHDKVTAGNGEMLIIHWVKVLFAVVFLLLSSRNLPKSISQLITSIWLVLTR